jgi:hypothetical protein
VNRAAQEIYHALMVSGALGDGAAIADVRPDAEESDATALAYRTGERVWVVVAVPTVSRQTFLKLAAAAMDFALDHEGVVTQTGIVCFGIAENFRTAANRLHISIFEVKKTEVKDTCGFCGSGLTSPSKVSGWHGCPRCQRLLKNDAVVRICPSCMSAYGACPSLESSLRELLAIEGHEVPPDFMLCPTCRSPDRQTRLTVVDVLAKAIAARLVTLDRLRQLKVPNEYLQLLHLRVQTRRAT